MVLKIRKITCKCGADIDVSKIIDWIIAIHKRDAKQQEAERVWGLKKDWCSGYDTEKEKSCEYYLLDRCEGTFTQCPAMKEGE